MKQFALLFGLLMTFAGQAQLDAAKAYGNTIEEQDLKSFYTSMLPIIFKVVKPEP